jgi:hypothetical protein
MDQQKSDITDEVVDIEAGGKKIKLSIRGGFILAMIIIIIIGGAILLTSEFDVLGCSHKPVEVKIKKDLK